MDCQNIILHSHELKTKLISYIYKYITPNTYGKNENNF